MRIWIIILLSTITIYGDPLTREERELINNEESKQQQQRDPRVVPAADYQLPLKVEAAPEESEAKILVGPEEQEAVLPPGTQLQLHSFAVSERIHQKLLAGDLELIAVLNNFFQTQGTDINILKSLLMNSLTQLSNPNTAGIETLIEGLVVEDVENRDKRYIFDKEQLASALDKKLLSVDLEEFKITLLKNITLQILKEITPLVAAPMKKALIDEANHCLQSCPLDPSMGDMLAYLAFASQTMSEKYGGGDPRLPANCFLLELAKSCQNESLYRKMMEITEGSCSHNPPPSSQAFFDYDEQQIPPTVETDYDENPPSPTPIPSPPSLVTNGENNPNGQDGEDHDPSHSSGDDGPGDPGIGEIDGELPPLTEEQSKAKEKKNRERPNISPLILFGMSPPAMDFSQLYAQSAGMLFSCTPLRW